MTGKSGYFDLTSGFFTVRTYWSETYEIDTNASVVQVDKLQVKTSYLGNEYPSGSIKIDGKTAVTFDGYRGTHSFYVGSAGTWVNVGGSPAAPWKISGIVHEADGTKSVTIAVSLSGTSMGSGWSVSGSKTVDLTAIPRASVPTLSAASPNVGDTVTLNTNRKVGSYTHDITYSVAGKSGTIGTNVGASVEWTIPMSLASAIAGVSDTLTIHTVTRNNGVQIGSSDISVTLRVPENDTTKPAINSVILTPQHDLPAKFSGVYVQGRSAVKAQVDATGTYSAIEKYSLYALGNTYTGNPAVTNALSITGAVTVKSTVTDKRGFTRSVTNEVLYYPYTTPSAAPPEGQSQITCKRCMADGSIDTGGTYLKIEAGKKFSQVNGINQCELRYRYAAAGGNFSPWVTLLEKGSASNSIQTVLGGVVDSVVTAYTVEIGVVDDIGSEKSVTFPIGTAGAVWHAAEGGNALGIGGYAQREGVDCQWNVHMNGKKLTGLPSPADSSDAVPKSYVDTLVNLIYPVGSIYISASSTSPATLFGGTWEQIKDRFLLAAGSSYAAGATGGEASHTLTVSEIPLHDHEETSLATGYRGWAETQIKAFSTHIPYNSEHYTATVKSVKAATVSANAKTYGTGGGAAHNNMPPYLAVYVWKRTG